MDFLKGLMANVNAEDLQFGSDVGRAVTNVYGAYAARSIQKERSKTNKLVGEINARAAARDARYQLGLSRVAQSRSGADGYSNAVFRAAENAREATRRVENERLAVELRDIDQRTALPSGLEAVGSFGLDLIGAYAQRNKTRAQREI